MKHDPDRQPRPRLIVGMSGASGAIYGVRLLQKLQGTGIETHLIMSASSASRAATTAMRRSRWRTRPT